MSNIKHLQNKKVSLLGAIRGIIGHMKESPAIFINPTAHASRHTRNRIKEHGREGWTDMGAGVIIAMDDTSYADLGRTLLRAVASPNWFAWIDDNEWEEADNG